MFLCQVLDVKFMQETMSGYLSSSYARAQMENRYKNITRSELEKQNIQANEVLWKTFGVITTSTQPGLESIWMATGTSSFCPFPATLAEANRAMGERKFHMVLLGSVSVRSAILSMSSHSS